MMIENKKTSAGNRLIFLDSMRGLAAIIVCFHHLFKISHDFFIENFTGLTYNIMHFISGLNHEAVLFFFVLSGFSIGLSLRNKTLDNSESLNEFIYRRFKRILPIYWIAIAVTFVAGILMSQVYLKEYSLLTLFGNLIFLQTSEGATDAWIVPYGFNGPFWSLSYEFFFYCFFPVVYLINLKYLQKISILVKFSILFVLAVCAMLFNKIFFIPYLAFFTGFPTWLLGYLCSLAYLRKVNYNFLFLGCFIAGVVFFAGANKFIPSNTLMVIFKGFLISGIFYFFTVYHEYKAVQTIFKYPVKIITALFYYIGKGSYALYALHYPILLVMAYYHISVPVQILILGVLVAACTPLEEWTIKLKVTLLKQDYTSFILNRIGY